MKKQRKVNRCSAKAAAVILAAAMVVQTTTPALALAQLGEGADARSAVSTASQSNAAKGDKHSDTAPSRASGSNAEKLEKATFSNAMRKEVKNLHPNGSFEFTGKTTNTNYQKVWVNEIMPIGWSMWPTPTGSEKMSFEIVTDPEEAADGDNYLHIRSENTASRLGISYPIKNIADLADQYLCTFQLKAEDVKGTGFNGRLTWLKKSGSGNYIETAKITGTSDGWVQYGLISPDQPADATGIQVEFYANNLSGEISLDDVQILPTYKLSLNKTETTMLTGDTLELTATCSDGYDEEVTWSSKDPAIADVDENGVVTAYAMGMVEIVAKTDTFHEAICKISIEDGELRPYYEAIRDSWRDRLTGNSMEDTDDEDYKAMMADLTETAKKNWDTMEKGGNDRAFLWEDIDFTYQKQNTASNVTEGLGTGFSRIEQMATAYSAKGSSLYHDEDLKADIIGAMEWVYATMYNDTMDVTKDIYGNWWHWFIGMPQSLCNTVILMYDDLDPEFIEREAKTLENFNEDPNYRYHTTGGNRLPLDSANLIDTSLVSALRASIGETALPLNMAKDALEKNLGFTSEGNGYYEDGSYIDHGNLAYTGGYGATLLGGIEKLLFITSDSPWEADSDKLTSIFQWIWNGIRPLYADGAMMDMTTGRGIARPSTNEHTVGKGLLKPISHLAAIAPEDERDAFRTFARTEVLAGLEYEEDFFIGMTVADMTAMKNLITDNSLGKDDEIYHKNFGAMDKAVYHGENFDLGISMYSKRTGSFEYGNKENRKGWHMSDGALYLYNKDQAHYADVYWPTVDPHRLAGITTDHTEGFIPSDDSWGPHVSTKNWVGGSSVLDQYGSVGMDFEGELPNGGISSLKAKKSWFTFPNGAAALGAGITSNENKATETIVDNRKAMEDAANT
ncbi:MAG: polysaccharide lyase family 8 super-sandwich domain-containing protein, partial [Hungatella hathewayi]|nr:polysaccharide lyase family 8 super-sandwich domain-containing protein [Hungatella hathewayi]